MIRLAKIIKEIMEAEMPTPPPAQVQQVVSNIISSDFVNYIKQVENGIGAGYDKTRKLWFPHKSVEGGMPTIGYGHKIQSQSELKSMTNGLNDEAVNKLLITDLTAAHKKVQDYVKRSTNINLMLDKRQSEMLTDFAFNGVLEKFPKFVAAVLKNDVEGMRKEYKRYSGKNELKGRNEAFYNRYLK